MEKYWKQFAAWAIDLRHDPFLLARLKLALVYTIIITLVIAFYLLLLNREFQRQAYDFAKVNIPVSRQSIFMNRINAVAKTTLFTVQPENIGMFFVTVLISYLLAGFALRPIKKTLLSYKQFLGIASHELRTPLSIIKLELETFLRGKSNKLTGSKIFFLRRKQEVTSNLEEIEKMQQIIDNLLFLSRSDSYTEDFRFSKVNFSLLLKQIIERVKGPIKIKGIQLSLSIKKGIFISAESIRLEQAFMNVIQNAIKYTRQGGKVEVIAGKKENYVTVIIADNGIGIAAKDIPHIFKRFYRAQNPTTQKTKGIGLGLYIARTIINAHKGRITVRSKEGKGTTI